MNLNKIFIIGRLTRDPEARTLPSGQSVSNFGMATNRAWTNQETKEKQEQTEFHNIVAFGRLAEICNQYLKKGSLTFIEGRIQTRNWQDQKGETKYRTEIVAETLQMGPRPQSQNKDDKQEKSEEIPEVQVDEPEKEEIKNEDIPF